LAQQRLLRGLEARRDGLEDPLVRGDHLLERLVEDVDLAKDALALLRPLLRRLLQRLVDDRQQLVVEHEAQRERDNEDASREDQPAAQLIEMLDDAEAIVVADGANRRGHGSVHG
jgi:hypothetical protein